MHSSQEFLLRIAAVTAVVLAGSSSSGFAQSGGASLPSEQPSGITLRSSQTLFAPGGVPPADIDRQAQDAQALVASVDRRLRSRLDGIAAEATPLPTESATEHEIMAWLGRHERAQQAAIAVLRAAQRALEPATTSRSDHASAALADEVATMARNTVVGAWADAYAGQIEGLEADIDANERLLARIADGSCQAGWQAQRLAPGALAYCVSDRHASRVTSTANVTMGNAPSLRIVRASAWVGGSQWQVPYRWSVRCPEGTVAVSPGLQNNSYAESSSYVSWVGYAHYQTQWPIWGWAWAYPVRGWAYGNLPYPVAYHSSILRSPLSVIGSWIDTTTNTAVIQALITGSYARVFEIYAHCAAID